MNPASDVAFFFDSDALIQIFLAKQHQLISILSSDFRVSSFVMSEVEVEVRSHRRFGGLIKPQLDKAFKSRALRILDSSDLENMAQSMSTPISLADIRELGKDYALDVGKGEAYTHAAGVLLDTPVVSNDLNAIKTLETNGKKLPPTILRSFDVFGFLYMEGYIDIRTAELSLKELKVQKEWMPRCLQNSSFEDGIRRINCRLSTSLSLAASNAGWQEPFYLKRSSKL